MLPSELGLNRLVSQFQDSPNLRGLISALINGFDGLDETQNDLLTLRSVDTAQGVQLDGVGEIVGLLRPKTINDSGRFGFEDDPTARGFGDINDPSLGGNWFDSETTLFFVDDDIYRLLIKAKIIKNSTAMTVDDTLRLISFVFNTEVRYFLHENLKPIYHIGKLLSDFELELLETFPTLIGKDTVNYELMYDNGNSFGFEEDPNALGFGDDTDPAVGGNFATLIII